LLTLASYPELRAALGGAASVPDFRGLFLRGVGGNSAAIGAKQEDAGRNVTASFGEMLHTEIFSGAFYLTYEMPEGRVYPAGYYRSGFGVFDASRIWGAEHTASEFRPANIAVRYLIRALP
jgi:hypothetical protein